MTESVNWRATGLLVLQKASTNVDTGKSRTLPSLLKEQNANAFKFKYNAKHLRLLHDLCTVSTVGSHPDSDGI